MIRVVDGDLLKAPVKLYRLEEKRRIKKDAN